MRFTAARGMVIEMGYQGHYEIHYSYPKFHRRVFANLFDFILFAFCFFLLFLGSRAAVTNMPGYVSKDTAMLSLRKESGLYHVDGKKSIDIVSYLDQDSNNYTGYAKMNLASERIEGFIAYVGEKSNAENQAIVQKDYDEYRLDANLAFDGVPYFVKNEEGTIVPNPSCQAKSEDYFHNAYAPFLDSHCQGYLLTMIPGYLELVRFESNMLFFAEIPIAFLFAGILVYLVPPLFFKKGRMTLGKAMYHIGLVDSRLLSCSFPRYLARWAIFFFLELTFSLVSFLIPIIVSFSLMVFSKQKQGLPDYLLGLYEIDASQQKIYSNYEEISLDGINGEKKPVDFQPTYED